MKADVIRIWLRLVTNRRIVIGNDPELTRLFCAEIERRLGRLSHERQVVLLMSAMGYPAKTVGQVLARMGCRRVSRSTVYRRLGTKGAR